MNKNSLVLYKNQCALVTDRDGDKYLIRFCSQPATASGKKAVYGEQKVREKGLALVPISMYFNEDSRVKVELAIARGKKLHDKRQAIAERDAKRDIDRVLKERNRRM